MTFNALTLLQITGETMTTTQHLEALKDLEQQISRFDATVDELKTELKSARDEREGLVKALLGRIRTIDDKQVDIPFAEAEVEPREVLALPAHIELEIPEERDAA